MLSESLWLGRNTYETHNVQRDSHLADLTPEGKSGASEDSADEHYAASLIPRVPIVPNHKTTVVSQER
jgi:hypothetical protein